MMKFIPLILLFAVMFSCFSQKEIIPVEIDIESFENKADIISIFSDMWTGIIDTASFVNLENDNFLVLHNSCSGLYCPSLYMYNKKTHSDSTWNLVFNKDLTRNDGNRSLEPTRIKYLNDFIYLSNREDEIVLSFSIDILVKENGYKIWFISL